MLDALSIQQIHCSGNMAHLFLDIILIPSILGFQRKLIMFKSCFRNVELTFMHHLLEKCHFCIFKFVHYGSYRTVFLSPMQSLDHPNGREQFDKILMGLLRRILDTNKRVQEAACSAFATLEEVIGIF